MEIKQPTVIKYLMKHWSKIWQCAFAALFIAVIYLSWKPAPQIAELKYFGPAGPWFDKHDHSKNFIGFAALGLSGFVALFGARYLDVRDRRRKIVWHQGRLALLLILFVEILECGQAFIPRRSADPADVLFGSLGILTTWAFVQILSVKLRKPSEPSEKIKRIVVWGINYAPEITGIAPCNVALCEELVRHGMDVTMVTGFPYYPYWSKWPDDKGRWAATDTIGGVHVQRCWLYVPRQVTVLQRILHECSFVLTSFLRVLTLPEASLLIVISPPLLLGPAAYAISLIRYWPYMFHVQDLQPDAAANLGFFKNQFLLQALTRIERSSYAAADIVSGIHQGMLTAFVERGVPVDKCVLFPNGTHYLNLETTADGNQFRRRQGINQSDFLLIYSGNLGVKQGLEHILQAMAELRDDSIHLVICGDGGRRQYLGHLAEELELSRIQFLPLQSESDYCEMLAAADACLVPQLSGVGQCFFPSKILSLMALNCAILSVADRSSELARVVTEAECGVNLEPATPTLLALGIRSFTTQRTYLPGWRINGRRYVEQFEWSKIVDRLLIRLGHQAVDRPSSTVKKSVPATEAEILSIQ